MFMSKNENYKLFSVWEMQTYENRVRTQRIPTETQNERQRLREDRLN